MLFRVLYSFVSVSLVTLYSWQSFEKGAGDWALLLIAVVFLVIGNSHLLKTVRFGPSGVTAEMTEVLGQTKGALEEVKLLAALVGGTTLSLVKSSGRLGGYSYDEEEEIKDKVKGVLVSVGVSSGLIEKAFLDWHKYTLYDYCHFSRGGSSIPSDLPKEPVGVAEREWRQLLGNGIGDVASPDDVENYFRKYGILTQTRKEMIEDYRYYDLHREHRRPEIWAMRRKYLAEMEHAKEKYIK